MTSRLLQTVVRDRSCIFEKRDSETCFVCESIVHERSQSFFIIKSLLCKTDFIRLCGKKKKTQKIIKIRLTYNVKFYIFCKVHKKIKELRC